MAKKKELRSQSRRYLLLLGIFFLGTLVGFFVSRANNTELSSMVAEDQSAWDEPTFTHDVTVEELGIQFKVPEELSDIIYISDGNGARFSTQSLTDLYKDCGPENGPLGSIVKYNTSGPFPYDGREETIKKLTYAQQGENPRAKAFDDFYIVYEGPHAACALLEEEETIELQTAQLQLFKQIIPTVELLE